MPKLFNKYTPEVVGTRIDDNNFILVAKTDERNRDKLSVWHVTRAGQKTFLGDAPGLKAGSGNAVVLSDGTVVLFGGLSMTGPGADCEGWMYEMPVKAPVGTPGGAGVPSTPSNGSPATTGHLELRIAQLEARLTEAEKTAKYGVDRANYVKGLVDSIWKEIDALKKRPPGGISRDEAWQLAADRMYAEVTTPGAGVRGAMTDLVREELKKLPPSGGTGTVDQVARDRITSLENSLGDRIRQAVRTIFQGLFAQN
ncbi:MAG TPA: hypothetical protein PKC19_13430 [Roseiflexaceae bacterium]|nr:hypothetical protein [Roseiflexaceae bacterium]